MVKRHLPEAHRGVPLSPRKEDGRVLSWSEVGFVINPWGNGMARKHVRRRCRRSTLAILAVVALTPLVTTGSEAGLVRQSPPTPGMRLLEATSVVQPTDDARLATKPAARSVQPSTASAGRNRTTTGARVTRPAAPGSRRAASASSGDGATGAKMASGLDPRAPRGGVFGTASVWKQNVRLAPLASDSREMVDNLSHQVADHWGGVAALNVWNYNASFYSVPANQRRVNVKFDDCQRKGYVPPGLFGRGGQFVGVPVPTDAVPAPGVDAALSIYQPSTDTLWEFWQARKSDAWSACWGGRIDHVSRSAGWFKGGFGQSASGLANAGGMIGIREAQAGAIEHALALQIIAPATWTRVSWPAQRSDGYDTSPHAIPEGTRLRLDPSLNVDALPLHPLAKMIAKAAQTYGFIVTDKSGAVAVVTENGAAVKAATGVNPWERILGKTPSWAVMKGFPWNRVQALPKDFGKP
jgi:hypothetical protein